MSNPYATEEKSNALIQKDTRTEEQRKQDGLADKQWLNEQGAEAQTAQKPWVGIDQQDVLELLKDGYSTEHTFTQAVRLIEAVDAKLKEKNT